MLVGIDVSHVDYNNSIIGFCATYNSNLSQYFSDVIKQKRRQQQIVDKNFCSIFGKALKCYESFNGKYP